MKKGNDAKDWKLGNLITLNQDGYPALGSLFVQIWEGDSVVARVYGESEEEVLSRANDLLARYVQTDVPEGWKLVPKEPTQEMRLAGKHTIKGAETTFEGILAEYAYLSMLEAAPKFGEGK